MSVYRDLAIFVPDDNDKNDDNDKKNNYRRVTNPITLPLAHARGLNRADDNDNTEVFRLVVHNV